MKSELTVQNVKASKEPWTDRDVVVVTAFSGSETSQRIGVTLTMLPSQAKAFTIGRKLSVVVKPK